MKQEKKKFNLIQINEIALEILEKLKNENVLVLSGNLGAGKTTLTKALAYILDIKENVLSPTFVLQKKYLIKKENSPFKELIHFDFYRLEKIKDLEIFNLIELAKNKNNLIIIEWGEKLLNQDIINFKQINLKYSSETERIIYF